LLQGDGGPAAAGGHQPGPPPDGSGQPARAPRPERPDPPGGHAHPLRGRPPGPAVPAVRRPVRGPGRVPGVRGRAPVDAPPAPGAVLLFDRIFLAGSIREMVRRRWLFHLLFVLVWGGFTGWHFWRAAQASGGLGFKVETVTPTQYALTETGVLLYYLRLSVWP